MERTLSRNGNSVRSLVSAAEEAVLYDEFIKAQAYYDKEMAKVV